MFLKWIIFFVYIHTNFSFNYSNINKKGIIISGGGSLYFTNAWINIQLLRYHNCRLPIELWYQDGKLTKEVINEVKQLNVTCMRMPILSNRYIYMTKAYSIITSNLTEILLLDSDNNCVRDPTYLFHTKEYKENGAIFCPDYRLFPEQSKVWKKIAGMERKPDFVRWTQESGQLLINKQRHKKALSKLWEINKDLNKYQPDLPLSGGDKDTFQLAWIATNSSFFMIQKYLGSAGIKENGLFQ